LLVAVLGILSGCRSSRDLEAFAGRHRETLNQALGLDFKRWPSDATFLYLFNKAHLQEYAQMTVYARALGVALAQTTYDTGESSERAALKELLSSLELEGVLIQRENGRSLSRQRISRRSMAATPPGSSRPGRHLGTSPANWPGSAP
jgi:hypothetical protein